MLRLLTLCAIAGSFSTRTLEPVVITLAQELVVPVTAIALLSTAFALAYGLVQPVLGPLGDLFGKVRVLNICLWVLCAMLIASTVAANYEMLLIARTAAGAAAGGTFPLIIAILGDRLSLRERQVALSRVMAAAVAGQLLGAITAGVLADSAGWRVAMGTAAAVAALAAAAASLRLNEGPVQARTTTGFATVRAGYAAVFRNRAALVCYGVVFIEGMTVFGFLPFVGVMLAVQNAGALEASIVIASVAAGAICFTFFIHRMMRILPGLALLRGGGIVIAIAFAILALQPAWQLQALITFMLGFGYSMTHNTLQTRVTELAPSARGSAASLHAFSFFMGQAAGPVLFGAMFFAFGPAPAILVFGTTILLGGIVGASLLHRVRPAV